MIQTEEGFSLDILPAESFLWQQASEGLRAYEGPLDTVVDIGAHVGMAMPPPSWSVF